MSYRNLSQIRGFGTLSRVVGSNTARLAKLGYPDFSDESGNDVVEIRKQGKSNTQCPVCWEYFDIGLSESDMSHHVTNCLLQPKALPVQQKSEPEEINLVEDEDISNTLQSKSPDLLPQNAFETLIVGRKYYSGSVKMVMNQPFEISWEPDNPHDPNAIAVNLPGNKRTIGHLPRKIAATLGPLLRDGRLTGNGTVLRGEAAQHSNVLVRITLRGVEDFDVTGVIGEIIKGDTELMTESSRKLLDKLNHIFQTVEKIESKALGSDEKNFLDRFRSHSDPCKVFFAKLSQRNKKYFSVQNSSRDGQDNRKIVSELCQTGLLSWVNLSSRCISNSKKASILSDIFQNKDLAAILGNDGSFNKSRSIHRADLISHIVMKMEAKFSFGSSWGKMLYQDIQNISGGIFEISKPEFRAFHRIQRLFFLNEGHSLATWHGVDEGFLRYPDYAITRQREVFPNQRMFLEYEKSLFHAHKLIAAIEAQDEEGIHASLEPAWRILDYQENKIIDYPEANPPSFFLQYNSKWIYSVMATIGIGMLEKNKQYKAAIERLQQLLGGKYCYEKRGYWWIRLSINLEHIGRPTDSLELAETALADSSIRLDEKLTLRRRILKLSKPPRRWKNPVWIHEMPEEPLTICIEARPLGNSRGERCKFIGYDSSICTVEQLALQFYELEENGSYSGIHSESGIWCTLFTLLLWPALFESPVSDTFRTAFQTAPLDLGHPGFYESRKHIIESILDEVRSGSAPTLIEKSWKAHYGVAVRGISWERYELSTIQDIASCIGGSGISAVCRLFCENYSTSGMPDLLLWNNSRTSCKVAEVKTTRDILSDKQRAWLSFLQSSGIPCEVLKIKEPETTKSRAKRRKGLH